jgi:hypothetical protein
LGIGVQSPASDDGTGSDDEGDGDGSRFDGHGCVIVRPLDE